MYTLVYVILALIAVYIFWRKINQKKRLPKGPKGIPFFGNVFQIDQSSPHQTFENWAKEFGDIYTIKLFGKEIVIVNNEELIREASITRADDFSGRPFMGRLQIFQRNAFNLSFRSANERWMKVKKTVMTSIKSYGDGLQRIEDLTLEASQGLIASIDSYKGQACDILNPMQIVMAKIVYSLLFSEKMNDKEAKLFIEQEQRSLKLFTQGGRGTELDVFPWLRHLGGPIVRELEDVYNTINGINAPAVQKGKNDPDQALKNCILSALLKYNETVESHEEELKDNDLFATVSDILFAGISTSSGALYSLLAFSVTHPEIGDKIKAEVDDIIGSCVPSLADRTNMPYVNAVLFEVLRIISHVPMSLPHCTTKEVLFGGHVLPKDQQIWLNLWSLHHDERYWEEPEAFKPERFLTPDGNLVAAGHPNRKRLMVFGAGRRVCIGESVAKNRLFILICLLFQRYNILPADELPVSNPRKFAAGFVLRPENYQLRFVQRESALAPI